MTLEAFRDLERLAFHGLTDVVYPCLGRIHQPTKFSRLSVEHLAQRRREISCLAAQCLDHLVDALTRPFGDDVQGMAVTIECLLQAPADTGEQFLQSGADFRRLFAGSVRSGFQIACSLVQPFAYEFGALQRGIRGLAEIVGIFTEQRSHFLSAVGGPVRRIDQFGGLHPQGRADFI